MLTDQELKKIRQEAEALYPVVMEQYNGTPFGMFGQCDSNYYIREAHVAAVIAERERADKKLYDNAYEWIKRLNAEKEKAQVLTQVIKKALEQYFEKYMPEKINTDDEKQLGMYTAYWFLKDAIKQYEQ